ncbi:peptidase S8/S53 domain-containing protein [Cokeromyces recurvatus]|uniref:peptidase S8/S53 domain-containing protein n=1 Tax=Cokeromyces recurvatus TaxID=90255 RepID=UPI002220CA8D|nr:peptidase S8/S53 domain-containing protein [Cokeromyces recurvatus]KAI7897501.1 peptidase S8/S53 domain-containing protein [Cokeromyces recurvatus]
MVNLNLRAIAMVIASVVTLTEAQRYMGKREAERDYYTINIPSNDGYESIKYIANQLGVRYEGYIGELDSWFMVSVPKPRLNKRDDDILAKFERLKTQSLMKRDIHWQKVKSINKQVLKRRTKRGPIPNEFMNVQKLLNITDPLFDKQWHLINQEYPGNDINVTGVWEQGITGKGVNVVILDDGLDYMSKDLADNFFAEGSYDFNDHESLPKPKLWDDNHGTRCAGQIAAVKNNVCGMGIAYEAKVAGVRILSGDLTDADEAIALNYEYQKNHIFSCSWGPSDNGQTMEAPNGILADAFLNGINNGRGGKGSIYVFATGNGAISDDNCNFDGYTNSIYTITVGAIDHTNQHPPYSESCSAQLVVTYSSGGGEYIHTTDVGENSCSDRHGGTSAAAPNAAGIFALVLSVRPDLTWRDLQHLCVQTAIPINTGDDDWKKLPSGRLYNHKFGYGKLDAYKLIEAAKVFELVNKQTWLELPSPLKKRAIPDSTGLKTRKALRSTILVTEEMIKAAGLLRLEHITATVNIEHQRRGNIVINLISPNNVESELATRRSLDLNKNGIKNWKFMSVKHWEENPVGNWTLAVYDVDNPEAKGHLLNWTLTLYGEQDPLFKGTPIHSSTSIHHDNEHEEISTSTSTISTTTTIDNTPSRPTRIKPSNANTSPMTTTTTTFIETSTPTNVNVNEESKDYLTIVYSVIGSIAIFTIALGIYFYKRHGWKASSDERKPGYEFDVLQPLTEINELSSEEDLSDNDEELNRAF